MTRYRRTASLLVVMLPLVAAIGCTGGETLPPGNGRLTVRLLVSPAVGPRSGGLPPFAWSRGDLSSVTLAPANPDAASALGSHPIETLSKFVTLDLGAAVPTNVQSVTLRGGIYKVTGFTFTGFEMNTAAEDPLVGVNSGTCTDNVGAIVSYNLDVGASDGTKVIQPPAGTAVEVPAGGQANLTLVMNGAALTQLLESKGTCVAQQEVNGVTPFLYSAGPLVASELTPLFSFQ